MLNNVEQTLFTHSISVRPTTVVNVTSQVKPNVRSTSAMRSGPSMVAKGNVARGNPIRA